MKKDEEISVAVRVNNKEAIKTQLGEYVLYADTDTIVGWNKLASCSAAISDVRVVVVRCCIFSRGILPSDVAQLNAYLTMCHDWEMFYETFKVHESDNNYSVLMASVKDTETAVTSAMTELKEQLAQVSGHFTELPPIIREIYRKYKNDRKH